MLENLESQEKQEHQEIKDLMERTVMTVHMVIQESKDLPVTIPPDLQELPVKRFALMFGRSVHISLHALRFKIANIIQNSLLPIF